MGLTFSLFKCVQESYKHSIAIAFFHALSLFLKVAYIVIIALLTTPPSWQVFVEKGNNRCPGVPPLFCRVRVVFSISAKVSRMRSVIITIHSTY
jgi:hypothetical protein